MNMLISNSFLSQLSSFKFIANCEIEGMSYHFNSDRFRCVESLQTANSSILIQDYAFKEPEQLSDWIKFFKKASSIEFNGWRYKDWYVGQKDIEFEGVIIKQVVFTNCGFESTNMIKKVIIDSGLANKLDNVTFDKPIEVEGKEGIEKMIEEYKKATKKNNMKVK